MIQTALRRKGLFRLVASEGADHGQQIALLLGLWQDHHGGRAWQRTAACLMTARKQGGKS